MRILTPPTEPLYYNVQGDKSNAELVVLNPVFFFNVSRHCGVELATNYYLRHTRYVYHDDVRANTFDFKVGVKWVI